ncbi:MAG: glycosyltransferase [Pseudomonadota bacterium]
MAATQAVTSRPQLAVIVPVYRDAEALVRLLDLLKHDTGVDEIIVSAATVSPDDLKNLKQRFPSVSFVMGTAGRGAQLNRGRAATDAALLWFLHADATPPEHGARHIRAAAEMHAAGGYFQFQFDGVNSKAASRLARLINWRARRGVPYGDQGLWFTAHAFDAAGGFEEQPLFEEVRLVKSVRRTGAFVGLSETIGVNPRRWRATGWTRRTLINRALALGHAAGISPQRLARWYARF